MSAVGWFLRRHGGLCAAGVAMWLLAAPAAPAGEAGAPDTLSVASLYNLGNARLREGRTGDAIVCYERALLLAPADPDITANLRLARTRAGLWNGETPALDRFVRRLSFDQWGTIAATAVFVAAAGLLMATLVPGTGALWSGLRWASIAIFLVALGALAARWSDLDRAVVTAREAPARVAPAPAAGTVLNLREGEVVHLRKNHGEFLLVRNRDGREGWVQRDAVTPVVPQRGS